MTPPSHHGAKPPSGSFEDVQDSIEKFRRSQRIMLVVTIGSFSFLLLTTIYAAMQLTSFETSLTAEIAGSEERITHRLDLMEQRISTKLDDLGANVMDVRDRVISIEGKAQRIIEEPR